MPHEGASPATTSRCEARWACSLHGIAFQTGTLSARYRSRARATRGGPKEPAAVDEPTNNLDPISRTAIAEGLRGWPGAMVIVSHDPEFVTALAPERVLLMPDGQLDYFGDDHLDLVELA